MNENIINKVINNEASEVETEEFLQWLNTEKGKKEVGRKFSIEANEITADKVELWGEHSIPSERMKRRLMHTIERNRKRNIYLRWVRIVAILIPFAILTAITIFIANRTGIFSTTEYVEIIVPNGERMQIVLQDGSSVELNSGSSLYYPKNFGLFKRKVKLYGEAFFSISEDTKRPFIVDLNQVSVKITGTKFNVKSYPKEEMILVSLLEGRASIYDYSNKNYVLKPGKTAYYNRNSLVCNILDTKKEENPIAWRTGILNFHRLPLEEIIPILERKFGYSFSISDSTLLSCKFTMTTQKSQIQDILSDMERVSHIRFVLGKDDNYQVLSK